jgi:dTDP-4-dehydrorhamnose 3,5-epimerase
LRLRSTPVPGAFVVEAAPVRDERGWFARTFDAALFAEHGLDGRVAQCATSFNPRAGTLRGMHFQAPPHDEAKLVRCTRGAIFDVALDLRPGSPTRHRWFAAELSAENGCALLIASGFAHGFQTLLDDTEVLYAMDAPYVGDAAAGVRWDDPAFAIEWPDAPPGGRTMSERDAAYPDVDGS